MLAKQLNAPNFEPHLTLCRAQDRSVLGKLRANRIRLRIRAVASSPKYTKTLFIRFHPSRALAKVIVDLGGGGTRLRDPHVSLVYKKLSARTKKDLAATIKLPFRYVTFDAVKTVRCPIPTETRGDVQSWRTVASKRLRG